VNEEMTNTPRRREDASPGPKSPEGTPSPPAKKKDVKRTPKAMRASPTKQVRSSVAMRSEIQKKVGEPSSFKPILIFFFRIDEDERLTTRRTSYVRT
jgi:hypothetical protein